jgi:hypothetical protein
MASVEVHADALLVGAVLVKAEETILALQTFDPVIDQHAVADLQRSLGVGADAHDFTGNVAAHDSRASWGAAALPETDVEPVEGAAADPEHHLTWSNLRFWPVAVDQGLRATWFLDEYSLHFAVPS